ncbi:vestitone reductase-like, partial [Rhododendron vialii]|uniref:vestitone reductase-like n=1 Tax=Rhododendron vialii TaxID=182163 RepID=UPI00265D6659
YYVASWLIMRLLQHGYKVRTTIRSYPDKFISPSQEGNLKFDQENAADWRANFLQISRSKLINILVSFGFFPVSSSSCCICSLANTKKDISFLTDLPGATENLQIFSADLDHPVSFGPTIEGCTGVFHVAQPIDFDDKEPDQVKHMRAIDGAIEILKACLTSKTVKRVVYTSSASAVGYNKGSSVVDENMWSDTEFIKSLMPVGASYYIGKTLTEKAVLEFGEKHGLDIVSVIPGYVNGPFICPRIPGSVSISLAMIIGDKDRYRLIAKVPMVHIDDVASSHIFLLEYPEAKGRYICSSVDITIEKMSEFLLAKYPQYQIPPADCLKEVEGFRYPDGSSKKLLDTGFEYKYGLEEMYDGAIQCCKEKGFL